MLRVKEAGDKDISDMVDADVIRQGQAYSLHSIAKPKWDSSYTYRNSETGKAWTPRNDIERRFVYEYTAPYPAILGGEGSGKTVLTVIADLVRVSMGMSGIVVSPNLPHFKRSLWPEFKRWCPWQFVIESQRYRQSPEWQPSESFELVFDLPSYPRLLMGGLIGEGGRVGTWEGPNISFFHVDEARHLPNEDGLKVLMGRARIDGPNGFEPQGYISSTGGCDWITEYYGPVKDGNEHAHPEFKAKTEIIILLTKDNQDNLSKNYIANRISALTDEEAEIILGIDPWAVVVDNPFLDSIILWDRLQEALPVLGKREPLVIGLDAGTHRDHFGMIGVTRHPDKTRRDDTAIRFAEEWIPKGTRGLDFDTGPLLRIKELKKSGYYIMCVCFDPYQLHQPMIDLEKNEGIYTKPIGQGEPRAIADSDLKSAIVFGQIAHDGDKALRKHIQNARSKPDSTLSGKIRIIKKAQEGKIDLAIALSMARSICKFLNL